MSTTESIANIRDLRSEVLRTNAEIRTLTNLAVNGQVSLRDFLTIARMIFGNDPTMAKMLADIQLMIALMGTAQAVATALKISLGPIGWATLAIGTAIGITGYSIYESTTGTTGI